jgi:hypothetical protein
MPSTISGCSALCCADRCAISAPTSARRAASVLPFMLRTCGGKSRWRAVRELPFMLRTCLASASASRMRGGGWQCRGVRAGGSVGGRVASMPSAAPSLLQLAFSSPSPSPRLLHPLTFSIPSPSPSPHLLSNRRRQRLQQKQLVPWQPSAAALPVGHGSRALEQRHRARHVARPLRRRRLRDQHLQLFPVSVCWKVGGSLACSSSRLVCVGRWVALLPAALPG